MMQICEICEAYAKLAGHDIIDAIKNEFSGETKEGYLAIGRLYDAKILRYCLPKCILLNVVIQIKFEDQIRRIPAREKIIEIRTSMGM